MLKSTWLMILFTLTVAAATVVKTDRFEYLYPAPNAQHIPPQAQLILRPHSAQELHLLKSIQVTAASGAIEGSIKIASDGRTLLFTPDKPLPAGETVEVQLPGQAPYRFTVSSSHFIPEPVKESETQPELRKTAVGQARIMPNGVSVPGDFTYIHPIVNLNPAPGYIFINNSHSGSVRYNVIFDNDGSPIWYLRTGGEDRRDFKVQKNGWITMLVRSGFDFGQGHVAYDRNYRQVKTFHAVNGYATDEHELQVLENGGYLLLGVRGQTVDMRSYIDGGKRNAGVSVTAIQEFTPNGELIFLWDALEQIDEYLPYLELDDPRSDGFRFPHMNAVDIDDDGHILLSCRHLSTVFKINRKTGEIIWRLGGEFSDFTFVNDPLNGFRNQHDIRNLGGGHYTVFDNGNLHNPPVSRGVEYQLDMAKMTATLVWEYRNPPTMGYSHYMGNAQRLPNGNTYINWVLGGQPQSTEVTKDGRVVYEMRYADSHNVYRSFRFPWDGKALKPTLYVDSQTNGAALIFNQFGDPDVAYYKIYGGLSRRPRTLLDTSKVTLKVLNNLENGRRYYFQVTSVSKTGVESDFSNEESAVVNILRPGVNMTVNGDFANGKDGWIFDLQSGADAEWTIENGVSHFKIKNGGSAVYGVQLRQNGIPLTKGETYLFEFDAWADADRTIEAKVGQDGGLFINYSRIGLSALTRRLKHFAYTFVMQEESDESVRVVFNCGNSTTDVYLDNISVKLMSTSEVDRKPSVPAAFELLPNFPNPFNARTTLAFSLPAEGRITVTVFNLLGEQVKTVLEGDLLAGAHSAHVDMGDLPSGVYFYQVEAATAVGQFRDRGKMLLVR